MLGKKVKDFEEAFGKKFDYPYVVSVANGTDALILALKALDIKESSVVIDKDNKPLNYQRGKAWTDIAVLHPNTIYIDGRPNWLFENGNKNVSISLTDIQIDFPIMVLAFKKGEDINLAVPIDITEVESKLDNCNLGLKKGDYVIVVTNEKQSFKFEQKVK